MKKAICGFLLFLTSVAICFAQQNNANADGKNEGNIILKAGTQLSAQLQQALDVETNQGNDDFVLYLTDEITGGGVTLPKGTELLGRVVRVKKMDSDDPVSEISLSFDFLKFGEDYLSFKAGVLSVAPEDAGNATDKKVSEPNCASSPVFKGATVISTKGKNLRLEPGLIFQLKLNKDIMKP